MGKNKMTKRQTLIYEILHRKLKIDLHGAHKKPWSTPKKVNSSCSTSDTKDCLILRKTNT